MAINVGTLEATLGLDTSRFAKGVGKAERNLKNFGRGLNNVGRSVSRTGRALTLGLTLPIVAAGALSVKAASDFESSFAGVRKTVDATEAEFAVFERQLRQLAKTIPINVNELNKIAEAAGQLGIEKKNILDFTETIAAMGVATNLTTEEAATGMARFANITQLPQKEISNLGSAIVDLGNNFATTEQEILNMSVRLAGAGRVIGLSEADTLGLATALSSVGIRAELGGSAFSRVMSDIASAVAEGGENLGKFAKVSGQSAEAFAKSFKTKPAQAISAFVKGLAKIRLEGGNTFGILDDLDLGSIRVRQALLNLAGAGGILDKALKKSNEAFEENNALAKEAAKRYETFESKVQLLKNFINDLMIVIGDELIPIFLEMFKRITPIIEAFTKMSKPTKKIIILVALFAAALGPVIFVVGGVVSAIGSFITVIGAVAAVISTVGLPILAAIIAAVVLVGTTFAVVAALIIANWDKVKKFLLSVWSLLEPIFLEMKRVVGEDLKEAVDNFKEAWEDLKPVIRELMPLIKTISRIIGTTLKIAFAAVGLAIIVFVGSLGKAAKGLSILVKVGSRVLNAFKGTFSRIFGAINSIISGFIGLVSAAIGALRGLIGLSGRTPRNPGKVAPGAQGFKDGGFVPGSPSQAVPIIAHGGEFVLSNAMLKNLGSRGNAPITVQASFPNVKNGQDAQGFLTQLQRIGQSTSLRGQVT